MAADITLGRDVNNLSVELELKVRFNDDADYWYLWPTMIKEIQKNKGELIDLYADAEFMGENLNKLEVIVSKTVENLVNKSESKWKVHVGTELGIEKKEIFRALNKNDLIEKLTVLLKMITMARKTNDKLISIGD